ncbi:MAG: RpiB/LacA/LacB family sugar-phosphate isomerase, partial [Erysipelotrichaceae bacterium]|nr:RpiB/LacA/LacB family sugar-phosphate isomerase [Erysipelotrichaceae bacterium]
MKLAIGNDHVSVEMKKEIQAYLEGQGHTVVNVGTDSMERFDYPISGYKVGKMVASHQVDAGILIC